METPTLEPQNLNVKLRVEAATPATLQALIPVFHLWIQDRLCPEQLIDVADYRHVPAGPGVVLIGHEANYSLDGADHHWGVRYNRKAAAPGTLREQLAQATRAALEACLRLEQDSALAGGIRFDGRHLDLFVNDRMLAPNTAATRAALEPELQAFLAELFAGEACTLTHDADPRRLFGVTVTAAQPQATAALLAHLGD